MNATLASGGRAETRRALAWTIVILVLFAATRLLIAGIPSEREYDEGVYLLSARSLLRGNPLFSAVFSSQPPAFLETLALAMRIAGDSLWTGRLVALGFALAMIAVVADLARRIAGSWAAPAAAAALALCCLVIDLAHVVQAETPAMATAMASLSMALAARRRGWPAIWLAATGALFGLALLYKLLAVALAPPLALLLLLAPGDEWRFDGRGLKPVGAGLRRGLFVAAGGAAILLLPLLFYDREALLDQTIGFHLAKHGVYRLHSSANLLRAWNHVEADAVIAVSGVIGLVLLAQRKPLAALWLLAWVGSAVAFLAAQSPVFWRHFVLLAPPLAIAAGTCAPLLAERFPGFGGAARWTALLVLLWTPVAAIGSRSETLFPLLPKRYRAESPEHSLHRIVAWIEQNTDPDELVVSDDPLVVYLAGREAPPALCDTSSARIQSGSLFLREAATETLAARVVVLRERGRLTSLPGYEAWLRRGYTRLHTSAGFESTREIWLRKDDEPRRRDRP
jgi:4-amino-4-deoxy-L-arabinose transferase-like glycosyltransferase